MSICARANQFWESIWKVGRTKFTKVHAMFMSWGRDFIAIHIYIKPDSPFSFCDLLVYIPVQLWASPPLPPFNYFSLPHTHEHTHAHTSRNLSAREIACWCNSSNSTRFVPSFILRKYQGNIKFTCPTVLSLDCFTVMNFSRNVMAGLL